MLDQATELRQLVSRSVREAAAAKGPPPRLVTVAAAPSGAGATTVAVNLAIALAECGARVVLVDADTRRPDVSRWCGLQMPADRPHWWRSLGDIHELLVRGPAGVQILPGGWQSASDTTWGPRGPLRLVKQLQLLGRHAELVILDVGHGDSPQVGPLWQAADDLVLVTLAEAAAVMEAYATLKAVFAGHARTLVRPVVNRATDARSATTAAGRLAQSCRRFLGLEVEPAVVIPPSVVGSPPDRAWILNAPESPPALACRRLADRLMLAVATRAVPGCTRPAAT